MMATMALGRVVTEGANKTASMNSTLQHRPSQSHAVRETRKATVHPKQNRAIRGFTADRALAWVTPAAIGKVSMSLRDADLAA